MSVSPDTGPVLVVGAGLAGLKCALELRAAGRDVRIFEASDGVGGRARTDEVEGFRLDRGFQVLLAAYPEAKATFDYERLNLGAFVPGARIRLNGSFVRFADPWRRPRSALGSATSPVGTVADKLRLARMWRDLVSTDPRDLVSRPEEPAIRSLEERGFSTEMIEDFFRPFFGGVMIDPDLVTSSRLMEIYFRCFSLGDTVLPAGGMGSLAAQLAGRLPTEAIELNRPVGRVEANAVELSGGERVEGAAVVVATEEAGAARLCGLPEPSSPGRVTTCFYFDAPESALAGPWLVLSRADDGPINELAVPSSVAEGYAPPGRSLVAASVIGADTGRGDLTEAVERQLASWFGAANVREWRPLASYRIERALPAFEPGRHRPTGEDPRLDSGVFICGDHRETPSIQGALVSGRKAARAVLA